MGLHAAKLKMKLNVKQFDQVRALLLLEDGEDLEQERQEEEERVQRMEHHNDEGLVRFFPSFFCNFQWKNAFFRSF